MLSTAMHTSFTACVDIVYIVVCTCELSSTCVYYVMYVCVQVRVSVCE